MTEPQNPIQPAQGPTPEGAVPQDPSLQSPAPQGQAPQGQAPYGQAPQGQVPYGQAPQGQAPYAQPPYGVPPLPKKKPKWPWILGALLVLVVIIIAVSTSGSDSTSPSGSPGGTQSGGSEQAAGLNTPVRDGKFEFVVTGVEKGLSSVGDNPYLTEQAQGQFVVVTITVMNTSDQPYGFTPSVQKLTDAQGRTFEPNTSAQIALGGSDIAVWDNINPGNTVTAKVVYDMPKDAVPTAIELHDSPFSGGVKVSLT